MTKAIANKEFTKEQIALIARTIAIGATQDELALFIGICKRTGLDPLQKQVYFIKSAGRVMVQISVDGFRVIAQRSGDYAGQDEPVFAEDEKGEITKCKVTVYRWHGETRYPAGVGVAYWDEYSKPSQTWKQMPHTMISKVAECIALRKAFPNDLGGLYEPAEIAQQQLEVDAIDATVTDVKIQKQDEAKKLMGKIPKELDTKSSETNEKELEKDAKSFDKAMGLTHEQMDSIK